MPKPKRDKAGPLSKYQRQKFQTLYTQLYGSVRILVKASNLPVSKVRKFFQSKHSYSKFTLATRENNRMRAFARFKREIWCLDLAYNDKLANDNSGVKYLLVRHDLIDRTVDAKK